MKMPKMLLLFSHALTRDQEEDANNCLNIRGFVPLSHELQKLWMNLPPTKSSLRDSLKPFRSWLEENGNHSDFVLIQGDFGAVYSMVNFAFSLCLIPVYATTERIVLEKRMQDNTVKSERIFKHKMFRRYEKEGV
jgi:hypothetical protein